MDADVMNSMHQFVLYLLQSIQRLFRSSMQQGVAIDESRIYDAACNHVGYVACERTTNVTKAKIWKINEETMSLTWSSKLNVLSKVIQNIFSFSHTSTQQPATTTDEEGRSSLWSLWPVLKKWASDLLGFRSMSLCKNHSCRSIAWKPVRQLLSGTVRGVYCCVSSRACGNRPRSCIILVITNLYCAQKSL